MYFAKSWKNLSSQVNYRKLFMPSKKAKTVCSRKNSKTWLVDNSTSLQGKLLRMRLFFVVRRTRANPSLDLMLVSFILTVCVKRRLRVCSRGGSYSLNPAKLISVRKDEVSENLVKSNFPRVRPQCKLESLYKTVTQKN